MIINMILCDFISTTQKGLQIHKVLKHKERTTEELNNHGYMGTKTTVDQENLKVEAKQINMEDLAKKVWSSKFWVGS